MYPHIQVWRRTEANRDKRVNSTSDYDFRPVRTGYLNIYEYHLDPPLAVSPGDFLGIFQPAEEDSQLILLFAEGTGPNDHFVIREDPLSRVSFLQSQIKFDNDYPLVAAETGKYRNIV